MARGSGTMRTIAMIPLFLATMMPCGSLSFTVRTTTTTSNTSFDSNSNSNKHKNSIPIGRRNNLVWQNMNANGSDDDDMEDDGDDDNENDRGATSINVLGTTLVPCCANVRDTGIGTGFYRNGYCSTGEQDLGRHTVCVQVTEEFLEFSASVGNDLSTPMPQYMFPGLRDGDVWCLCAQRWAQAYQAGKAPKLYLMGTHEKTLDHVPFPVLRSFALDATEADQALDDLNDQREKLNKLL